MKHVKLITTFGLWAMGSGSAKTIEKITAPEFHTASMNCQRYENIVADYKTEYEDIKRWLEIVADDHDPALPMIVAEQVEDAHQNYITAIGERDRCVFQLKHFDFSGKTDNPRIFESNNQPTPKF